MLRKVAYGYFIILGILVAVSYSELVRMPTPFNLIWWLALGCAALLAIPIAIYSLWCRDRVLLLLSGISVAYGGLVLPPLLGHVRPVLPLVVLKILDWAFVTLCIGVPCRWFSKR